MAKRQAKSRIKFFVVILLVVLVGFGAGFGIPFGIKCAKKNELISLGYSQEVASYILKIDAFEQFTNIGHNETLNHILLKEEYEVSKLDSYIKINYVDIEDFLPITNQLLAKNYSPDDINFIFKRFSHDDITTLLQRDYLAELQEYFSIDYAKLRDLDRYLAYKESTNADYEQTVLNVALNLDLDEYESDYENTDFALDMLVNKNFSVSEDFEPKDLVEAGNGFYLNQEAYDAFLQMQEAARTDGLSIEINSAYRSVAEQKEIMNSQCRSYGESYCESHVAVPGFSEHHTGLALDIKSTNSAVFEYSKEFNWVIEHAADYGFILRYPEDKEDITRYSYEAWHFRYLGKDLAQKVKDSGLSYEEYYVKNIEK